MAILILNEVSFNDLTREPEFVDMGEQEVLTITVGEEFKKQNVIEIMYDSGDKMLTVYTSNKTYVFTSNSFHMELM